VAAAKPAEVKPPPLDPKYQKLPLYIFGACAGISFILFLIGLAIRPADEAPVGTPAPSATAQAK